MKRHTLDDIWDHVDMTGGPDACWPFTGWQGPYGYGDFSIGGRHNQAHRVAFIAWHGPVMHGLGRWEIVMHRCDNRICCNPHHLTLGTTADNNADMRAKGRAKEHTHGAQHGTYSGYMRHAARRGGWTMPACQPCKDANAAYQRNRKASAPVARLDTASPLAPVTLGAGSSTGPFPLRPDGGGSVPP